MSQKESKWEQEFEKVMGCIPECANGLYEDVGCPAHGYDAMKTVKFFRKVLSNREKEIADEVKKKVVISDVPVSETEVMTMEVVSLYDVLQLLKH